MSLSLPWTRRPATCCTTSWNGSGTQTGCTIIFVTHNVREAARLGDRVAVFTFRPGRIKREFAVDQPRPRQIEDPAISRCAKEILDDLREEINKSLEQEYRVSS